MVPEAKEIDAEVIAAAPGEGLASMANTMAERDGDGDAAETEEANEKALAAINRVASKLDGKDFDPKVVLKVADQVELLIVEATSHLNLCQCYIGWWV